MSSISRVSETASGKHVQISDHRFLKNAISAAEVDDGCCQLFPELRITSVSKNGRTITAIEYENKDRAQSDLNLLELYLRQRPPTEQMTYVRTPKHVFRVKDISAVKAGDSYCCPRLFVSYSVPEETQKFTFENSWDATEAAKQLIAAVEFQLDSEL